MARKSDLERRIKELDRLRAKGVITDTEYETRRTALMSDTAASAEKKGGFPIFRAGCLGLAALAVLVVIVAVFAITGSDETEAPGQVGSNQGDVHVPLAVNASGIIAPERNDNKKSRVTILQYSENAVSTNQFERPDPGKRFWAVQVTVENVGTEETTSLDWKMRDSKDNELNRDFVSGVGESLDSGTLTPGGKKTGWVVFKMDVDATPKWLRADPNPFLKNDLYFDAQ